VAKTKMPTDPGGQRCLTHPPLLFTARSSRRPPRRKEHPAENCSPHNVRPLPVVPPTSLLRTAAGGGVVAVGSAAWDRRDTSEENRRLFGSDVADVAECDPGNCT